MHKTVSRGFSRNMAIAQAIKAGATRSGLILVPQDGQSTIEFRDAGLIRAQDEGSLSTVVWLVDQFDKLRKKDAKRGFGRSGQGKRSDRGGD
jgi:hypothetical protein